WVHVYLGRERRGADLPTVHTHHRTGHAYGHNHRADLRSRHVEESLRALAIVLVPRGRLLAQEEGEVLGGIAKPAELHLARPEVAGDLVVLLQRPRSQE